MRLFLLFLFSTFVTFTALAQASDLPVGKYQAFFKQSQDKWSKGDIILIDNSHYKISSDKEVGEYRFSATAQRIFFINGPLKSVYAKTQVGPNETAIIIPLTENKQPDLKLSADVWAYLKVNK